MPIWNPSAGASTANGDPVPTVTSLPYTVDDGYQALMSLRIDTDDYLYIYGDLIEMD